MKSCDTKTGESILLEQFNYDENHDSVIFDSLVECMIDCGLRKDKDTAILDFKAECKEGEVYFIAKKGDKVIGFVSGGPRLPHPRRGEFELFHIGVRNDLANVGIGHNLLHILLQYAKDYYKKDGLYLRKFWLTTSEKNLNGQRFYERNGMNVTGISIERFNVGKKELEYSFSFDENGNQVIPLVQVNKEELLNLFKT